MGREFIERGLLLGLAVLLQACAAGSMASGGGVVPTGLVPEGAQGVVLLRESRRTEPELSEARRAEAECALAQVWGIVQGLDEVGARVELRFWGQGGALTLLSHRTSGGQERVGPVDERLFAKSFRRLLTTYVGERTGEVIFTLHRTKADWHVDFRGVSDVSRPPEAKMQPVRKLGRGGSYEIHHRCPLEYAHLFLGEDINARSNLAAVARPVHQRISKLWTTFRKERGGSEVNAAEVKQVVELIDRHFQRWYDVLHDPRAASALDEATEAALKDLERLLARG